MANPPTISIIIPTHNRPKLILEAINSIIKQTYQDFEIIIINDCSTKKYPDLTKIDNRIKVYNLEQNSGPTISRNLGMDKALGKYIGFLDDDDLYLPNHFSLGVEFLNKNLEYHGVYFDCQTIKKGKLGRKYGYPWKEIETRNPLRSNAMIFKNTNIRLKSGNDFMEDYRLWRKFHKNNLKCNYIPIVTCQYRKDYSERSILGSLSLNDSMIALHKLES